MVQAKNSFFICFRRSILKGSPLSLIYIWSIQLNHSSRELTSQIQSERDKSRDRNTQLAKFLFKLNLVSLYSPNLILCDLLVNYFELLCSIFLSRSAHLSWVCCHSLLILSALSLTFFSVLSLLLPIGLMAHFYVRDQVLQV
jgi:hypothetical protein